MSWLAVNKDGTKIIFQFRPRKTETCYVPRYPFSMRMTFPKGSIEKLIGRKLTFKDEPYKFEKIN